MAYRGANIDRISHLPSEIIQKILNLLPCRDAVRTSILSSDWRYKWMSMTDLNFGEVAWGDHAKFITKRLGRHQEPIRKFSVTIFSRVGCKVKPWLKLVSKHDIEEVKVVFQYRSVISPARLLLNCKKLTHLELSGCLLDVPLTFEGFMNLKVLNLSDIEVKDKTSIESLISKSPLLESISLNIFGASEYVSNITIFAPKVEFLSLRGDFKGICLQNSLVLGYMRLDSSWTSCDLIKIFGDAPNLFNCKKLTHLDLSCKILTIPPTFEGFMNLKSLKLSIRIVDSSIESLISKSPLLESLSFNSVSSNTPITISAPKIKYLYLRGNLESFCLEKSPALVDMSLYLLGCSRDCDLIRILGGAPNLEKLMVEDFQRLKFGCYHGVLSTIFSYLKVMTLDGFNFGENKAIQLVLEVLRSAPNLEKLGVIYNNTCSQSLPNEADFDFWQKEYLVGHCFMKLKVVEMGYILCKTSGMEFAKFILSNSPILEKMTIGTREWNHAILTRMLKELSTLPRASAQVAVTIHGGDSPWCPIRSLESLRSSKFLLLNYTVTSSDFPPRSL